MQISFELVRSTLACVVLRNVGTVPLEVKSLIFNETFTKQLQTKTQERLKKKESTSIVIEIDFSEYAGFLDYVSEVDEFKNSIDNLKKSMESIDKDIKKLAVLIEDGENYG